MRHIGFKISEADPCLYYKGSEVGLIVWLSLIDDYMVWGTDKQAKKEKYRFVSRFDCDDIGEVKEYIGCKIDKDTENNSYKFTQSVTIQSFRDEFELGNKNPKIPVDPGSVLVKADDKNKVSQKRQTYYRSGVEKLQHMTRWSRPDIQNTVRDVSRQGRTQVKAHVKAMHMIME